MSGILGLRKKEVRWKSAALEAVNRGSVGFKMMQYDNALGVLLHVVHLADTPRRVGKSMIHSAFDSQWCREYICCDCRYKKSALSLAKGAVCSRSVDIAEDQ